MVDDDEFALMLVTSGVDNELGHHEHGRLHTAITTYKELRELVDLAYDAGRSESGHKWDPIKDW